MRAFRVLGTAAFAAGLLLAPSARAAFDGYLKIDGITGESQDPNHVGWIEVDSYQFDTIRAAAATPETRRAAALAEIHDLKVTKLVDPKSSPKLHEAAATGRHLPRVTLQLTRKAPGAEPYLVIEMKDVIISSVTTSPHANGANAPAPTETLTLNYGKIEWVYTLQKEATPLAGPATQVSRGVLAVVPTPTPTPARRNAPPVAR